MQAAAGAIVERVRDRVRAGSLPVAEVEDAAVREVEAALERARRRAAPVPDGGELRRAVLAELLGFGAVQALLDDPLIEEIWINGPDEVFVAVDGVSRPAGVSLTDAGIRELVERMLRPTGRRVDLSTPFVDASLPDGSRLHVVIPDITRRHWAVNIRKFVPERRTLADLVAAGTIGDGTAAGLLADLRAGASVVVSGATHAGKTTVLRALLGELAATERIVTVEETFELAVAGRDVVALQGRPANLEGHGAVPLRRLVTESLRMRPDRIVVGEVRGAEALDLLVALNTGVPGAATVHANSAADAIEKLTLLPMLAGGAIDGAFLSSLVRAAVDTVVHCERAADGTRRVAAVERVPRGVTR